MSEYTDQELASVQATLGERYKQDVEIRLADCEAQSDNDSQDRVERPALFWHAMDCNFVVVKLADHQFQGFFFYQSDEHFSNAQQTYADPVNCAIALMQFQADQFGESQGCGADASAAEID